MGTVPTNKKGQILALIRENPFVSQQELADALQLSRSAVASYISALVQEGEIVGRAYVLPTERRVTCIGGANLDRKIQSLGPLQSGTSNPAVVTESHGGVARNIAENLGRMGVGPSLITMVGQDGAAESLLSHCRTVGVDVGNVIRSEKDNTGTYTAVLDVTGEMAVALADMAIYDGFLVDRLASRWQALAASTFVIVDTNLPKESLQYLIARCRDESIPLCVVPVSSPKVLRLPEDLRGVSLLMANMDEVSALTRQPVAGLEDVWAAGSRLKERGCQRMVITMGREGCAYIDEQGDCGVVPAHPVEVLDVTGAGDAFSAGLVYGLAEGCTLNEACRLGTRLSSLTLSTKDTVSKEIRPEKVREWMDEIRKGTKENGIHA